MLATTAGLTGEAQRRRSAGAASSLASSFRCCWNVHTAPGLLSFSAPSHFIFPLPFNSRYFLLLSPCSSIFVVCAVVLSSRRVSSSAHSALECHVCTVPFSSIFDCSFSLPRHAPLFLFPLLSPASVSASRLFSWYYRHFSRGGVFLLFTEYVQVPVTVVTLRVYPCLLLGLSRVVCSTRFVHAISRGS